MTINPFVSDSREAKLPQWVQTELARLRSRVADAERIAEEARLATDPDESDAIIEALAHPPRDLPIGLGKRARVKFKLKPPGGRRPSEWRDYVEVRVTEDGESIVLHGGYGISVHPSSTNSIHVRLED